VPEPRIVTIAGGVGAARLLRGLTRILDDDQLVAIVNVGDDLELHGLSISPDLDTVTYTVAEAIDPERGWGLVDETWNAMATVGRYGGTTWFGLGDRDIGTHLYRTARRAEGATLSQVTAEITRAWGIGFSILPATDDRLRTMVTLAADDEPTDDGATLAAGSEIPFQEYFVRRHHSVPIAGVRFDGAETTRPAPGVLEALDAAELLVIAPSNPIVSIGPVLAVPGVRSVLESRRDHVVAVSPIVAGAALKGPADRMLTELGHDASVVGVARLYAPFVGTMVIDHADAERAREIEALGMRCVVTNTIMGDAEAAAALGRTILSAGDPRP
jgi:LPPG:FO 2-phospho-L-lactate transferase